MKRFSYTTVFMYVLCTVGLSWLSALPGQAQLQASIPDDRVFEFKAPTLDDRDRPPGRARGGASRGHCAMGDEQAGLTALVPTTRVSLSNPDLASAIANRYGNESNSYDSVLSLTTETHPSFWFYLPSPNQDITLEFVLQNEAGNTLYQTQMVADVSNSGIVQLALPATVPALAIDQPYQWFLVAHCDAFPNAEPIYVKGWVTRTDVDASLQAQMNAAPMLEQASLYAANGIWQDALTILGERYRDEPQNAELMNYWVELLTSAGFDEVATAPLVECCAP